MTLLIRICFGIAGILSALFFMVLMGFQFDIIERQYDWVIFPIVIPAAILIVIATILEKKERDKKVV